MTDQLNDGVADEQEPDIEMAADASILSDEGQEDSDEIVEAQEQDPDPATEEQTPDQMRAKFEQTRDIDDLPEADRPFFQRYKTAFNREMHKARQMVKEAAERQERYEALLAQGRQPATEPDGPPDLGDSVPQEFKTAFDARVEYGVQKALERMGLNKRLEGAEEKAMRLEGENRAREIMSELTTKHGMTTQEQEVIEGWIGEDPNLLVNFQSPGGRARMVKMARMELKEARDTVSTVQRQANAAGAAITRPASGSAAPTPTDYRKIRQDKGMDETRDYIVEETLREMGGKVPSWP